MNETRKIIIEQKKEDDYRRVSLEENIHETGESKTPKWDSMASQLKENAAEKSMLFARSFINSIIPATILIIIVLGIIIINIFGGIK